MATRPQIFIMDGDDTVFSITFYSSDIACKNYKCDDVQIVVNFSSSTHPSIIVNYVHDCLQTLNYSNGTISTNVGVKQQCCLNQYMSKFCAQLEQMITYMNAMGSKIVV